ncbi:MAG: hypothetical protein U9N02_02125 [Campylobacterota bacterium]|nr:hypothetical protein [Campylobacterota bacterium]
MFVSSYSTYINSLTTDKTKKRDIEKSESQTDFSSKLHQNKTVLTSKLDIKSPINYISNYKSFANKQKIEEKLNFPQEQNLQKKEIDKYKKINTITNAKSSYETNSQKFSLLRVPHITLNQVQKNDEQLPIKLQQNMVNTYIANDNYYKVTA